MGSVRLTSGFRAVIDAVIISIGVIWIGFARVHFAVTIRVFRPVGQTVTVAIDENQLVVCRREDCARFDFITIALATSITVGISRIGLTFINVTVSIRIFKAIEDAVSVGIRIERVCFVGRPDAIAISVFNSIGEAIVIRVGLRRMGLPRVEYTIAISVFLIIGNAITVRISSVWICCDLGGDLKTIGTTVSIGVWIQWVGGGAT